MNHKRISSLSTIFILAIVILVIGSVPAAAQVERIYFSGQDCPIYLGPPERQWVSEDGVLHQRSVPMITTLTYDTPYLTGMNYLVVNMDVDLATGAVHVYGTTEVHPDGIEGTLVGRFSTHVSPEGVINGNGAIHGTGELEGMIGFINISSPDVPDPACANMNTASNGTILLPNE